MIRNSQSGQLILPVLAILFLFGMFWVTYVLWCRNVYWRMRMDVASSLTALSAAREEAALLNYAAMSQFAENAFLPEFEDYGVMQVSVKSEFEGMNNVLKGFEDSFRVKVPEVAQAVAQANGANMPAYPSVLAGYDPLDNVNPQLKAHSVTVLFLQGIWPAGMQTYSKAYFTRQWSPNKLHAQPPHKSYWTTCHDAVCKSGRARLWLNVDESSALNNGGYFPSENRSLLRSVGIQCFYPQFDAQLEAKH